MFPIPWNFPFRKKNGNLVNIGDAIDDGTELPVHGEGDAGKVLIVDENGNLEWSDDVNAEIQTLTNNLEDEVETRAKLGAHNFATPMFAKGYTETVGTNATMTVNDDYSITLESSSAITAIDKRVIDAIVPAGEYKLSGAPAGASESTYHIWYSIRNQDNTGAYATGRVYDSDVTVTVPYETHVWMYIEYAADLTVGTKVFKPMIRLASDPSTDYAPYAMTNRELTPIIENIEVEINNSSGGAAPYSYYGSYQIDSNKIVLGCWARQKSNDIPLPCTYNPSTGWFGIVANGSVTAVLTYSHLHN